MNIVPMTSGNIRLYFSVAYSNYSGHNAVIDTEPTGYSDDDVSDWEVCLPLITTEPYEYRLFILDTDAYYDISSAIFVYDNMFSSLKEAQTSVEKVRERFHDGDVSWSSNDALDDETLLIYVVIDRHGKVCDKGMITYMQ